jgi:hypothetical protein
MVRIQVEAIIATGFYELQGTKLIKISMYKNARELPMGSTPVEEKQVIEKIAP